MQTVNASAPRATGIAGRWQASAPQILAIFRIIASFIFIQSGTMKLFAIPAGVPPDGGTVELFTQVGIGALMEVVGGALVLVGLYTRPVAFVLAGEMAVAYFQFHQPGALWPTMNGGVPAIMYCFFFLYLSAAGAGIWSLDALRERRAARTAARDLGAEPHRSSPRLVTVRTSDRRSAVI